VIEIGRHRAHRRLPFLGHQGAKELVVGGGSRGAGILRIKRKEQDLAAALLDEPVHPRRGRRVAVAHAEIDDDAIPVPRSQARPQLFGLRLGDRQQRAFIRRMIPDRLVVLAGTERPLGQDDQLQQRLPDQRRIIDHPAVRQEFVQVPAHRPVVIIVRRPEVGHQNTDLAARNHRMVGRHMLHLPIGRAQ